MRVRLMQQIDYWVGIPLCFFCACINFLLRLIPRGEQSNPSGKIMLVELSEMGSAILAHSAIEQLKRKRPESEVYFLIFERNRESVAVLGSIPEERILTIKDSGFFVFALSSLRMIATLRRMRLDAIIDLELFSRFTALLSFFSGASNRVGFSNYTNEGLYRGNFLTHPVLYNPHRHMSLNFLALIAGFIESSEHELPLVKSNLSDQVIPLPAYRPDSGDERYIQQELASLASSLGFSPSKILVVNPDPGDALPIRGWPVENFVESIRDLLSGDEELLVIVIGLPQSEAFAREILSRVDSKRCVSFVGKTKNLSQLMALFSKSDVLLTNDSGPAHLASLTGLKTLVLFGPETPALYGPLGARVSVLYSELACSPCLSAANHRYTTCSNNRCLKSISTAAVGEALRRVL